MKKIALALLTVVFLSAVAPAFAQDYQDHQDSQHHRRHHRHHRHHHA